MSLPQFGDFLQLRRELCELTRPPQGLHRAELLVRCLARPDEVGVVGVREPVRTRPCPRHDRTLLEHQHGLTRTGESKYVRDRLESLRVGHGVALAVEDGQTPSFVGRDPSEESRSIAAGAANLQVW